MRWKDVCKLGRQLPEVEEGTWFGVPALRVRGSILAQSADRGKATILKVATDQRDGLCRSRPGVFSVPADQQQHYPMVKVNLGAIDEGELWPMLVESWRRSAPPSLANSLPW